MKEVFGFIDVQADNMLKIVGGKRFEDVVDIEDAAVMCEGLELSEID
jgi:hypothetical protein